jgi:hypothetical protein
VETLAKAGAENGGGALSKTIKDPEAESEESGRKGDAAVTWADQEGMEMELISISLGQAVGIRQ